MLAAASGQPPKASLTYVICFQPQAFGPRSLRLCPAHGQPDIMRACYVPSRHACYPLAMAAAGCGLRLARGAAGCLPNHGGG